MYARGFKFGVDVYPFECRVMFQHVSNRCFAPPSLAAPCYEKQLPFRKIDVLSECLTSVRPQTSKARNGCKAYAEGWEAGDHACAECGEVGRRFRPCDLDECVALCSQLYAGNEKTAVSVCMGGCYRYDYLLIEKMRTRGSPSTAIYCSQPPHTY